MGMVVVLMWGSYTKSSTISIWNNSPFGASSLIIVVSWSPLANNRSTKFELRYESPLVLLYLSIETSDPQVCTPCLSSLWLQIQIDQGQYPPITIFMRMQQLGFLKGIERRMSFLRLLAPNMFKLEYAICWMRMGIWHQTLRRWGWLPLISIINSCLHMIQCLRLLVVVNKYGIKYDQLYQAKWMLNWQALWREKNWGMLYNHYHITSV